MKIQNSEVISKLLTTISNNQSELENLRQLLNQQPQFSPQLFFEQLSTYSIEREDKYIDLFCIKKYLAENSSLAHRSIQKFVKFYSDNELKMDYQSWQTVVLCRKSNIKCQFAKQRKILEETPRFVYNFCKKIIIKECELHQSIIKQRSRISQIILSAIQIYHKQQSSNFQNFFLNFLRNYLQIENESSEIDNILAVFKRYIKKGSQDQININDVQSLFCESNNKIIADYLEKKGYQIKRFRKNPFVSKVFTDLSKDGCNLDIFSIRQVKSIQSFVKKGSTSKGKSCQKLGKTLKNFQKFSIRRMKTFCQGLRKIIKIQQKTIQARQKLWTIQNFNPKFYYNLINKDTDNKVIPSSLQYFLQHFNIELKIKSIFHLFKRFTEDGKMSERCFKNIFKIDQKRKDNKEIKGKLCKQTTNIFLHTLLIIIENQAKIAVIKQKYFSSLDLKDIFTCIDEDQDKNISQTDIRILWKRFLETEISLKDILILWKRFRCSSITKMINYQIFMGELACYKTKILTRYATK